MAELNINDLCFVHIPGKSQVVKIFDNKDEGLDFANKFEKKYGYKFAHGSAGAIDGVLVLKAALERVLDAGKDPRDGAALRDALEHTDMQVTQGRMVFTHTNHEGIVDTYPVCVVGPRGVAARWENRPKEVYPQFPR